MPAHHILRLAALAILCCCCAFTAAGVELPREMVAQYPLTVERIKEVYAHATISGSIKRELPQTKKFREQDFVRRTSGQLQRLDLTTRAEKGFGLTIGATDMYMAAPYASLHTYRGPNSQVFDTADEESYAGAKSHIEEGCPLSKVFSLGGRETLLELLHSRTVTITNVRKVTIEGTPMVKIYFQQSGRSDTAKSWLAVSPSEGWALREYVRTVQTPSGEVTYRGAITYNGLRDGAPLVQQIETWKEQGSDHQCVEHEIISVSEFTLGDPDHDYFAAFGLGPGRTPPQAR
jgi:hypothetical protein